MNDLFQFTLTSQGVWIGFQKQPSLDDIQSARDLLDRLTDDMIGDAIEQQHKAD